jgi:glutaryl-CoA dehydrogenase
MSAYEHALRYARTRIQFGRPIGGFQLVQDLLVRRRGNVTACQAMMLRLAHVRVQGQMLDERLACEGLHDHQVPRNRRSARELLGGSGILQGTMSAASLPMPRPSTL